MTIEVRLFATLAQYLPSGSGHGSALLNVAAKVTVGDVMRSLGIPEAMPRIVLVNGQDGDVDDPLSPGDVVTVFPPLAGGRE